MYHQWTTSTRLYFYLFFRKLLYRKWLRYWPKAKDTSYMVNSILNIQKELADIRCYKLLVFLNIYNNPVVIFFKFRSRQNKVISWDLNKVTTKQICISNSLYFLHFMFTSQRILN